MPEGNSQLPLDPVYIYRCNNRKRGSFKKRTESKDSPLALLESTGKTAICPSCDFPMAVVQTKYPEKGLFKSPNIGEVGLYDDLPDWLTNGLDDDTIRPVTLTTLILCIALVLGFPARANAQQQPATVSLTPGTMLEVGFSPGGSARKVVLDAIASAKDSIHVACYEFTSRPIAEALIKAANNGIKVSVVADYKASLQRYSLIPYIEKHGIPVRRDAQHEITHDKYLVLDTSSVETGSYNYTSAADKANAENCVALYGVPYIASQYLADWQKLWNESR